LIERYKHK